MLHALLETYLTELGFQQYEDSIEHRNYWYHPSLGAGHTLLACVDYAMGCEEAGRDLKAESDDYLDSLRPNKIETITGS